MLKKLLSDLENENTLTLDRGKVISKIEMNENKGDYPFYSSSTTKNGEFGLYGNYMFEDERITLSIDGGGRFFYRPKHKYSVTNVCGWIKVNNEKLLNTEYLYYNLMNQWKYLKWDYSTKAHPSNIRNIYAINIIDIKKQKSIVNELNCINNEILINKKIIEILQELIKSQFDKGIINE